MKSFDHYLNTTNEIGFVEEVYPGLCIVSGLPTVTLGELVIFEKESFGMVFSLNEKTCEIVLLSEESVRPGTKVTRTNKQVAISVGENILGHTINPLCIDLHSNKNFCNGEMRSIDQRPSGIASRERITGMLATGTTIVDTLLPLGKGQRELIIGDRKTGKTNFLLRTMVYAVKGGTIGIYAAIGKKRQDIKKAEEYFKNQAVDNNIIIVASSSDDPSGIIYLTPYTAMTIAEYFRDRGNDVLIVLDDLTTHAKYYRELSLLARRFPGRNAYPADSFHIHARLLERAGNFKVGKKTHAITCLPVAETQQGDLSGYIQTNLMAMTDGHLYFDVDLFTKGQRPAINPFLSVTRVGRQTQNAFKRVAIQELTSFLSKVEKLHHVSHFGQELSPDAKNDLSLGQELTRFFNQPSTRVLAPSFQWFMIGLIWDRYYLDRESEMEKEVQEFSALYDKDKTFQERINQLLESETSLDSFSEKARLLIQTVLKTQKDKP